MSNAIIYNLATLLRIYPLDVLAKIHLHICIKISAAIWNRKKTPPVSTEGRLIRLWYDHMVETELNYTGWDGKYATCSTK